MSKSQLNHLFSVPVFVADDIGGNTTVQDLKNFAMSDNRAGIQNISDEMNVLGSPKLHVLREAILAQVLDYLSCLGVDPKYEVEFVSSWVSRLKRFSNHTEHFHPCSQWSGVYYPVDQDKAANLDFSEPLADMRWIGGSLCPDRSVMSVYSTSSYSYETPGDRLLLFPSDQPHRVTWPLNITEDERYSLAFNIMLSGEYTTPAQTVRIKAEPL